MKTNWKLGQAIVRGAALIGALGIAGAGCGGSVAESDDSTGQAERGPGKPLRTMGATLISGNYHPSWELSSGTAFSSDTDHEIQDNSYHFTQSWSGGYFRFDVRMNTVSKRNNVDKSEFFSASLTNGNWQADKDSDLSDLEKFQNLFNSGFVPNYINAISCTSTSPDPGSETNVHKYSGDSDFYVRALDEPAGIHTFVATFEYTIYKCDETGAIVSDPAAKASDPAVKKKSTLNWSTSAGIGHYFTAPYSKAFAHIDSVSVSEYAFDTSLQPPPSSGSGGSEATE